MKFKVIEIIDADTIRVTPDWIWNKEDGTNMQGNILRIWGYFVPPKGTYAANYAKEKLTKILKDQMVELKNPKLITKPEESILTKIVCDVYLNDVNIMSYFPEYKA